MSDSVRAAFDKLPALWKMSVIRCLFYCVVQAINGILSGLDGYTSFAEISWFALFKLACAVTVDVLMTWIAFLDQSIKAVAPNTETVTTVRASNETVVLTPEPKAATVNQSATTAESK